MTTIIRDKHGRVLKTIEDTGYHPDGTGPRAADGRPIVDTSEDAGEPQASSAAATVKGAAVDAQSNTSTHPRED